ncbi:MAG: hypothetical protein K2K55_00940 [Duncaniella sp.]|nr:hypothetical protein [Duncaniella sp.]
MKPLALLLLFICSAIISGCRSVDDDRIPYADVRLTFRTVGEWNIYGLKGDAATAGRYIFSPVAPYIKEPADFPYTSLDRTGFGGILLVADVVGDLHAFDLACPVDVPRISRLVIDNENLCVSCPDCGSTYEVFSNPGMPRSGPAATQGYSLKRYHVSSGGAMEYRIITR